MKRFLFFLIFIIGILSLWACDTEKNIAPRFDKTFIKLYGGEYKNQAVDLLPLADGGFAILGSIINTPSSNPQEDILFIIADSVGNIQIRKQIGDPIEREQPIKMIHDENGYAICGNYLQKTSQEPNQNVFIYRLTNAGDSIESRIYERWVFSDMAESPDDNYLVITGTYQNVNYAQLRVTRNDLSDTLNGPAFAPGYGVKVDEDHNEKGIFKFLGSLGGRILIKKWDLNSRGAYFSNDNIGDDHSIPVDFLQGKRIGDNYIILGYNDEQSIRWPTDPQKDEPTIKGPFISEVKPVEVIGKLIANHYLDAINDNIDLSTIIPSCLYRYESSNYLLLGTERGPDVNGKIRLLKLDPEFKVIADRSFGTGAGDKGVTLQILPDNSVVFLATVNYVPDKPGTYSKIALFKLTPDLSLDY